MGKPMSLNAIALLRRRRRLPLGRYDGASVPALPPPRITVTSANRRDVIGLDLDGTLLQGGPRINYDNPEQLAHLMPNLDVVAKAIKARQNGWHLVVITGRTENVRYVTEHQVSRLLGDDVPVVMQDSWHGVEAMIRYKAQALRDLGVRLYVGDSRFDEKAAGRAGCLFRRPLIFGAHGVPASDAGAADDGLAVMPAFTYKHTEVSS